MSTKPLPPSSRKSEPFQAAWAPTASRKPVSGAKNRTAGLRLPTAIPIPMPVKAVNSGCANGLNTPRITKSATAPPMPPDWPSPPTSAAER